MVSVLILGAGIQGICCAYALHDRGHKVTLVEQSLDVFSRTSLHQEGRVHMGFTYALDRSNRTGEMMMHSALNFSGYMERWLGRVNWESMLLDKGYYLIHKDESLLAEDEIISYYERLQETYSKLIEKNQGLSYFGSRPAEIYKVLDKLPGQVAGSKVARAVFTEERIVEMFKFKDVLVENIRSRAIEVLTSTTVQSVSRGGDGHKVTVTRNGNETFLHSDIVVNCLWNNRIKIDKLMGIPTVNDPLYRLKVGLLGKVTQPVPNCTIVSGAFGNISPRLDGSYAYIAWHKDCLKGMTTDGTTPLEWDRYFEVDQGPGLDETWVKNSIQRMADFIPGAQTFQPIKLLPGIICSTGKTDIDDKESDVHKRADQMGIFEAGGYYSINTGKFSSAPLLAQELLEKIDNKY